METRESSHAKNSHKDEEESEEWHHEERGSMQFVALCGGLAIPTRCLKEGSSQQANNKKNYNRFCLSEF